MKIALIYNSKSIDSVLTKHITIGLFPNFQDYTFIDTGENVKFYNPTDNEILTYDKFIFIDTYPTLLFFNQQFGNKLIEVYSGNTYIGYAFDEVNAILHEPENNFSENTNLHGSLSAKYLYVNYSNITNGLINQLYSNKNALLEKFRVIVNQFNKNIQYQKTLISVGLKNDDVVGNLLMNDHIQLLVNMNNRTLINDALNLQMKQYIFDNTVTTTNYISIVTDQHKLIDSIIQLLRGDLFIANEIKFIEYTKFVDNTTVELTLVSTDNQISIEPLYNKNFGLSTQEQSIIAYLELMYNLDLTNFMDNANENIVVNYDNSITVKVPMLTYLYVKNANELPIV